MAEPKADFVFCALGGLGEIGMNAALYGYGLPHKREWILIDCGVSFAGSELPGIDLVLPDLKFLEGVKKNLKAIIITHAHEDHIGAVPYLAADLGVPLYATPFTAGLIRLKLEEEGLSETVELNVIGDDESFTLGPFGFRYIPLAHSIPEGNAVLIDTPYGRIFHTGDWKLDEQPLLGQPSTPEELTAIGDDGVLALVCDSTNVFNARASGSEADVRAGLMEQVSQARGRVLVTTFASNAARVQTLGEVAAATGRKLCVAGRSLDKIIAVAKQCGYLKDFPPLIDADQAMLMPRNEVLIIATGGQGEARAALARVAAGTHPVKLDAGDTVIFSSKQIPGNEIAIGKVQNALAEQNIIMVTEKQAHVHVSGHPGRPELEAMYGWIRPEILVPVHGERRHMAEQARVGIAAGIKRTIVQSNGDLIRLAPKGPAVIGHEATGRLVIDGDIILPADGGTINERRKISMHGQISVAVAINAAGQLQGEPVLRLQGIPVEEDRDDFLDAAAKEAAQAVPAGSKEIDALRERVRLAVRRTATRWTGKKPIVDVLIIEL